MLVSYLKIAVAVLLRRKVFTAISLFGITFTLAILLAGTAVMDHIFGKVPPELNHDRTLTVLVAKLTGHAGSSASSLSYGVLERTLRGLPGAEKTSIVSIFKVVNSFVEEKRVQSFLKRTDAEFWEIFRFEFLEGRSFTADEVEQGAMVAVINADTRERFFAGRDAVGQVIEVDGSRFRVVGVVTTVPILRLVPFSDIWIPHSAAKGTHDPTRVLGDCMGVVLAHSRTDFPSIRAEFLSRLADVDLSAEGDFDTLVAIPETTFETAARVMFTGGDGTTDRSGSLLAAVVAVMLLFMILPAVNLVNLNISRIMERASEIGVRKAFGASTWALVGQFVAENVVLTLIGGGLALVLTWVLLVLVGSSGLVPYAELHMNLRIFGYGLLTALVFGLVSGVYPAWRMSRMHPVDALRGGTS